ncbi:hypothetical protein V496_07845 [Pseudogymnoascus sp. VKM F-4515 (FW-2607)]|nr:hypothetical protein V496_07845 [Pseudogymnoascus sp. VKM F-4515 (FW-2607)]
MDHITDKKGWEKKSFVTKPNFTIPEATRRALIDAIHVLEETTPVDYHPGSDNRVVDLVHPSMFPLVNGQSHILRDRSIGMEDCLKVRPSEGEIIPIPPEEEAKLPSPKPNVIDYSQLKAIPNPYSRKFQWLPCDVQMEWPSGCNITSYINNLHPTEHAKLYPIIEEIIACSSSPTWPPTRITYSDVSYRRETPTNGRRFTAAEVVQPEPQKYTPWEPPSVNLRLDYWGSLQVIVKLANIELTPEKPEYEGGSWHVEGQLNEHICAKALYYYSNTNITESRLSFRQESDYSVPHYVPNQIDPWISAIYGCENHGPRVQEIIDVECRQGRLLTFPNIFQHRVQPFSLRDPSKPGHRKILALFLVDPAITVISTGNVPPQRADWWIGDQGEGGEGLMGMGEGKGLRVELMEERKVFVGHQDAAFQSLRFNLCEH